jgi:glycosyltransferase involved in cell wall biosynthesis
MRDFRKLWRKLSSALAPPRKIHDKLFVVTLPQIPFRRVPFIGLVNRWLGAFLTRRAVRKLGFRQLISWFVVPHPGLLAKRLGEVLTVYYCVDDYAGFPGVDAVAIQELDDHLTRQADVVFVVPPTLVESKRALNANVHFSPHGVDVDLFSTASDPSTEPAAEIRSLRHPVVGYFGALSAWIDYDLLVYLSQSRPLWTFLLIGYASADVSLLRRCQNVILVAPQPYETLPRWVKAFDVGIIPYRLSPHIRNRNPLKLREYLAAGKPVVSVTIPEAVRFSGLVYLADTREDYLAAIERALAEDTPELSRGRIRAMAGLSWEVRFQETITVVEELLGQKGVGTQNALAQS